MYGKLIYINVAVYILTQLWWLVGILFNVSSFSWDWSNFLGLPAEMSKLLTRPWTLITYMFCHADLKTDPFHIVFNMLWLYWLGQFFLRRHTSRQLLSFYLVSGLFAGLFFLFCYNTFPLFSFSRFGSYVVGASGVIFALMTVLGMNDGEQTIGLNLFVKVVYIKMKWLMLGIIGFSILFLTGGNFGGLVCHIGGVLFGIWYAHKEEKGKDICAWMDKLLLGISNWFGRLNRPKMTVTKGGKREPISAEKKRDMDYNADKRRQEEIIDAILDKIKQHGYDGLTAEEKQMLFDASKRKQQERMH